MTNLIALVFITLSYLPGEQDVSIITHISKDPYMSATLDQCETKKQAILAQTKEKNLSAFCIKVER